MAAGLLDILGVDMGDVRLPDSQNPTGYFENQRFNEIGDRAYGLAGIGLTGFAPPYPADVLARGDELTGDIEALIAERAKVPLWGWKTIHTGLLFDLFAPYLDDPRLVVVLRNPLDTARSCMRYTRAKRNLYDPLGLVACLQVENFYLRHIYATLERYEEIPALFMSYERVLENPTRELRRLAEFVGVSASHNQARRAEGFVQR